MVFPRKHLFDGEEFVVDRRPHLLFFALPVLGVLASVLVGGFIATRLNPDSDRVNNWISWAMLALVVAALAWLGWSYLSWRTTNFVITTDRIIYRHGVLAKRGQEIPLEKVNDVSHTQTIFERLTHSGDLVIESSGTAGQTHFHNVGDPVQLQNLIHKSSERANDRDLDRIAGGRAISIPEQIEQLEGLRAKGMITDDDFEAKKIQLLGRM